MTCLRNVEDSFDFWSASYNSLDLHFGSILLLYEIKPKLRIKVRIAVNESELAASLLRLIFM